jgi:diacylglycerol kinase family enzyme
MEPPLLIVNPACGSARALPAVLSAVERKLGDAVIRYTARRGHARELALQAAEDGYDPIVAVGGDGTFSEVVNGVLSAEDAARAAGGAPDSGIAPGGDTSNGAAAGRPAPGVGPAVGLINVGTGGDFRRSLGIGADLQTCLDVIASGKERLVDVGRATFTGIDGQPVEQYFVNVLSAGLGGLVDRYVQSVPGFLGGLAGYYLASVRAVVAAQERPLLARVTWEGTTRELTVPAYLVAICNGRWFGGGMDIAPMASPDDGRLEVLTITERNKLFLTAKIRKVYSGRHLEEPTVGHFPCDRIELRIADAAAQRRFLLDVDGDPLGSLPLTVEIVPRRLRVRA